MFVIIENNFLDDKRQYYCIEKLNPLILSNTLDIPLYLTIRLCKQKYLEFFPSNYNIKETKKLKDFDYNRKELLPITDKAYIDLYIKSVRPESEQLDILYTLFIYNFKFKIFTDKNTFTLKYSDDIIDIDITDISIELKFKKNIKSETGNFYFEVKKFKMDLDSYSKDFLSALI